MRSDAESVSGALAEAGHEVAERTRTAWGHRAPDMVLRGARLLLASGELATRDVGVVGRRIAVVAEDIVAPGEASIDLRGKTIVPGYIEPHCHTFGPLSIGSYCSQALIHGTAGIVSDDSFLYGFLEPEQYPAVLDYSERAPLVLRWSLRLEGPRTVPLSAISRLIERGDVTQVGELMTRPVLDQLAPELAELIARARSLGLRVEGHSPGASARTLTVAAAAGVTADHESQRGEELIERLRCGLWAFIRYTDLLRDAPVILAELLAREVSLERTAFTSDWSLPPWIARQGIVDAAIASALKVGVAPEQAYATASRRPADYLSLGAHLGAIAPARLASFNVLADVAEPTPERVFSMGREVARDGDLLVKVPDVDWRGLGAPRWSNRRAGPDESIFHPAPDDPQISLESSSMIRPGRGDHQGEPLTCLALDPDGETFTRAALFGLPPGLEGIASTLTPRRLLVALGSDPTAIARCVDAVIGPGGGIAFRHQGATELLELPVGGVITSAPFAEVLAFWDRARRLFAELGQDLADPLSTLLYIGSDSLPGARFNARGLFDTRAGRLIAAPRPAPWS